MFASNDEVVVAALDEAMLPSWDQLGLFAFTWFRSSRWSGLENILFAPLAVPGDAADRNNVQEQNNNQGTGNTDAGHFAKIIAGGSRGTLLTALMISGRSIQDAQAGAFRSFSFFKSRPGS